MNVLSRQIIEKKADLYKESAAKAYGFATLLSTDDCIKSIVRKQIRKIGVEVTEEQLDLVALDEESAAMIIRGTCDIINYYAGAYKEKAVEKMREELSDRGINVRIGLK